MLRQLVSWFEDYNTSEPHGGLRMRSPREFIKTNLLLAACPVSWRQLHYLLAYKSAVLRQPENEQPAALACGLLLKNLSNPLTVTDYLPSADRRRTARTVRA